MVAVALLTLATLVGPSRLVGAGNLSDTPVTPNASPEVCSLLTYCSEIYGQRIISGQQEGWRGTNELGFELRHIQKTTGKLPALLSLDVMAVTPSAPRRDTEHRIVKQAADWYLNRNGIISLCWHWFAPVGESAFYTKDTAFEISRAVTAGTPEHEGILRDIDAIAAELKLLQDQRVPVLWRPLHEANGRWFWWGAQGPEPFKQLWQLMFERMVTHHNLTNLLWVYSPGAGIDLADWYPGDAYVDIIGQDHYPMDGNHGAAKDVFDELVALRRGSKLVGMSENGPIPDPVLLASEKAGWLFFITWSGRMLTDSNPTNFLSRVYAHPHLLNLGDLPVLKTFPFERAGKATILVFPTMPDHWAVGSPGRTPLVVAVQDARGRTVREGCFNVALAAGDGLTGSDLRGGLSARTVNGIATFADLEINKPGKAQTLKAVAEGLATATSPAFETGPGDGLVREWWTDAPDITFEELSRRTNAPAGREVLGRAFEMPVNTVTNYAVRFRGWLRPPVTGEYQFRVANTASSELWLSTDATQGRRVKLIAITKDTPYSKWPHTNEALSGPVKLEAGRQYWLEFLQQQPAGSAHLSVGWRLPDGVEERPIPAWRFATTATVN